jgi:hypothetical protein
MRKKLKAQLKIWYAKHPLSRERGASRATKGRGGADKVSDDERCQRPRVYNDSASDDNIPNGCGDANAEALAIMGCTD